MINALGKIVSSVSDALDFNQATLSGCIDVIAIDHGEGTYKSTPFHVRFGKLKVLKTKEKTIRVEVNDQMTNITMKMGSAGEAYFEEEIPLLEEESEAGSSLGPEDDLSDPENYVSGEDDAEHIDPHILQKIENVEHQLEEEKKGERHGHGGEINAEHGGMGNGRGHKKQWTWKWGEIPEQKGNPSHHQREEGKSMSPTTRKPHLQVDTFNKAGKIDTEKHHSPKSAGASGTKSRAYKHHLPGPTRESVKINRMDPRIGDDADTPDLDHIEYAAFGEHNINANGQITAEILQDSHKREFDKETTPIKGESEAQKTQELPTEQKRSSQGGENEIEMSLCKDKIESGNSEDLGEIFAKYRVTYEEYLNDPVKILSDPNLLVRIDDKLFESRVAVPIIMSFLAFGNGLPHKLIDQIALQNHSVCQTIFNKSAMPKPEPIVQSPAKPESTNLNNGARKSQEQPANTKKQPANETKPKTRIRKFLRPTSEMIKGLNLKPGANKIRYIVESSLQGNQSVMGFIYLWPKDCKIVISDIDGTITKSDVLGHIMPMVGGDWSHDGVAQLYTSLAKNGYQILYLTARAIGQSFVTRKYLKSLNQKNLTLPNGPVIMSPDRLIPSLKREVIHRKPEVFKIACLRDIKNIFPHENNPFVAGFGNRDTDAIAYRAVGIHMGNIFIINPKSQIQQMNNAVIQTYLSINEVVHDIFPALDNKRTSLDKSGKENKKSPEKKELNQMNFSWLTPTH